MPGGHLVSGLKAFLKDNVGSKSPKRIKKMQHADTVPEVNKSFSLARNAIASAMGVIDEVGSSPLSAGKRRVSDSAGKKGGANTKRTLKNLQTMGNMVGVNLHPLYPDLTPDEDAGENAKDEDDADQEKAAAEAKKEKDS